jgi:hypothetical protein
MLLVRMTSTDCIYPSLPGGACSAGWRYVRTTWYLAELATKVNGGGGAAARSCHRGPSRLAYHAFSFIRIT